MEENTKEMIVIDSVDRYNEIFGLETRHPLVSIIDLAKSTTWPTRAWFRYEVYALYLKNVKCGDIKYGRQYYDYQDGTIVCFAPGQITDLEMLPNIQPNAHGILFHPDLIRGTALGQEIKKYSFFSYETNECLCFRFLSAALIFFMRPAQSGQYFPRFDLGTKAAPQTAHRFRLPRYKRAAASSSSRGRTATRNHRHMREREMLWTHTQGSPSSNSRQFPPS